MKEIERFREAVRQCRNLVFFGGAGVSTASGIPDFRSANGLYATKFEGYAPEYLLSRDCFDTQPELFFDYYRQFLMYPDAKPNIVHKALAALEKSGRDVTIVTQNVDGLHEAAGSQKVYDLHGCALRNYCMRCHRLYAFDVVYRANGIPRCTCGGIIKPDVVLYGEPLDNTVFDGAERAIRQADLMIVGGTSLAVYPAAGLVQYYRGQELYVINKQHLDVSGGNVIQLNMGLEDVFGQLSE